MNRENEERMQRVRKSLELDAIRPQAKELFKDLLNEDGRPEEERKLTPEEREMVRVHFYNMSRAYLQVLREEKSSVHPMPKTLPNASDALLSVKHE